MFFISSSQSNSCQELTTSSLSLGLCERNINTSGYLTMLRIIYNSHEHTSDTRFDAI